MSTQFGDHTLRNLGLLVLAICMVLGTADVLRGTGGWAWISSADAAPVGADVAATRDVAATVFRGVRIFDGETVQPAMDVVVENGYITAVGQNAPVPAGARTIDGTGKTLFPGLIDSHTHAFGPVLRAALMVGVTAELDMFTEPNGAAVLRAEQARGAAGGRADLFSAGVLATSPGGHGTEYGMTIPTLTRPDEADGWVQARLDEGSDYIKIVYDDGSIGRQFTTLDLATVTAVIEAAHARDLLAVVHVGREVDALAVIDAGADGIVHVFHDTAASDDAVARIAASGAFVVPTLAVLESISGGAGGAELLADEHLAPFIGGNERQTLENGFPTGDAFEYVLANALDSVGRLHAAGVPILAGTDAPNPGTAHGASLHRELELLVRAGLSPAEALTAATTAPAAAFGLDGRGGIAVGMRADLVLVDGNPLEDITESRAIAGVWKLGAEADRATYRADLVAAMAPAEVAQVATDGMITGFEAGVIDGAFGSGWMVSTDAMVGGTSTADMTVVDGGADGTAMAMQVTGEIVGGSGPAMWAGPMFFPGAGQFAAADVSAHEGIGFWLRGDGAPISIMLFAQSLGQMPSLQIIPTTTEWTWHLLSFGDFAGVDPTGLQGVLFSGAQPGEFEFYIDEFQLR
jgi:imidazolonepropionase-like amidohydrolase